MKYTILLTLLLGACCGPDTVLTDRSGVNDRLTGVATTNPVVRPRPSGDDVVKPDKDRPPREDKCKHKCKHENGIEHEHNW